VCLGFHLLHESPHRTLSLLLPQSLPTRQGLIETAKDFVAKKE